MTSNKTFLLLLLLVTLTVCLVTIASGSHYALEDLEYEDFSDYDFFSSSDGDSYGGGAASQGLISKVKTAAKKIADKVDDIKDKIVDKVKDKLDDLEDEVKHGVKTFVRYGVQISDNLLKILATPSTYPCFFNQKEIKEKEKAATAKIVNYRQDAAAAFYATNEYNSENDKNLPNFETVSKYLINTAKASFHINRMERLGVVSVQGTQKDWAVNFNFTLAKCLYGPGKVHKGFQDEVRSIVDYNNRELIKSFKTYLDNGYTIVFTGHSQGGPESVILAQAAAQAYPAFIKQLRIATLAAPRVGDSEFVDGVKIDAVRYVAKYDIVPSVIFRVFCYRHVGERRAVACPHDKKNFLNCHFPEYYFDDINNRQTSPYDVAGATIADEFNFKHSNWDLVKQAIFH